MLNHRDVGTVCYSSINWLIQLSPFWNYLHLYKLNSVRGEKDEVTEGLQLRNVLVTHQDVIHSMGAEERESRELLFQAGSWVKVRCFGKNQLPWQIIGVSYTLNKSWISTNWFWKCASIHRASEVPFLTQHLTDIFINHFCKSLHWL